jgi:transglutaminase-like putative cysteine protease
MSGPARVEHQRWIPRHCFAWLLLAQFAVIAPHLGRLPLLLVGGWLLAAGWRTLIFQGRAAFPPTWVKLALIAVGVLAIRRTYGNWMGLEPSVAFLIACFSFKLLESSTRRDAYLLFFLGYFVALTEFLFEQGLGITLYMLVPVVLLTTGLLALHQPEPLRFTLQPLRTAAKLALQAVPLMLLLFLVFPRLAPLWQVPMPGAKGTTGLSDEMAPGDIASLSQSGALAFRAQFDGPAPANSRLYWRALVMDDFDGRRWRAGGFSDMPMGVVNASRGKNASASDASATRAKPLDYRVFMEPTYRRWLYALETPAAVDSHTELTWDYRLLARDIVHEKFSYRARAFDGVRMDAELHDGLRARTLRIPSASNPRAQQWARDIAARYAQPAARIDAVLREFREQSFYYTLKPPTLGAQAIDEFLFDTRRGFCEHYAGSFVFVMRAAGIPARVVTGYQGGERNPLTGTVLVHQFDAHAWAEVWLEGRGWVRVDPTAAVAPNRIEQGLENAVGAGEFLAESPFAASRYRHVDWLNAARMRFDQVNYQWTRWVVNYRDDTQEGVLRALLGDVSSWRIGLLLVGGGALALGAVAFFLLGRPTRPSESAELRLYRRFLRAMARRGYPCPPGMAPAAYARWLRAQNPRWEQAHNIADEFSALSYQPLDTAQRRARLKALRGAIVRFQFVLR